MRIKVIFLAFLVVLIVLSCSSPIQFNGGFSSQVVLDLQGVMPKTYTTSNWGARALSPATTQIRALVTGDNFSKTFTGSYSPGMGSFSMNGIPVKTPLTLTVESLDASNNVLTSCTKNLTLDYGKNNISCTLVPASAAVVQLTSLSAIGNAGTVTVGAGQTAFYAINLSPALYSSLPINHDFQIIANTKSSKFLAMEIFDANWNPIAPISQDISQGWAVVNIPPTGANYKVMISSPSQTLSPEIQVRTARFVAASGSPSASGRSDDPLMDLNTIMDEYGVANLNYYSLFLANGNFAANSHLHWINDCRVYGGYTPGDWKTRNASGRGSVITAASTVDSALTVSSAATGFIEGLTVQARDPQPIVAGPMPQIALDISSTNLVLKNSTIYGSLNQTNAGTTMALLINGGTPTIIDCTIDGGVHKASTIALEIDGGRPYLENCLINGGTASNSSGATSTTAVFVNGGSMVMNRCTVYGGNAAGGSTSATTTGISIMPASSGGTIVVSNSLVSGGYANGRTCYSYGIYRTSSASNQGMLVVGATIDSGFANGSLSPNAMCINWTNGTTGTFAGNVLSVPTNNSIYGYAFSIGYQSSTVSFMGNSLFGSWSNTFYKAYYDGSAGYNSLPNNGTNYQFNATVQNAITGYFISYAVGGTFSNWLSANLWSPAAGQSSQFNGSYNPATILSASDISSYPGLLFDRAGNPRPSSGNWTRGAYQ